MRLPFESISLSLLLHSMLLLHTRQLNGLERGLPAGPFLSFLFARRKDKTSSMWKRCFKCLFSGALFFGHASHGFVFCFAKSPRASKTKSASVFFCFCGCTIQKIQRIGKEIIVRL
mmetsp:Transcript_43648/g.64795  ORF Transcript_43648/g.64795 Transcript_43648/m.64795 type:complete len:116 (-) Transcript_43648:90-437(-)